jgi:oligoendopeptidase F
MKILWGVVLGLIGLPAAAQTQPQTIDETRYFATVDGQRAEFKQRLDEAAAFPTAAPADAIELGDYLRRAETLLAQLQRHDAYLLLRASRDIEDAADADAVNRADDAMTRLITSVGAGLRALGTAVFARDAAVNPALKPYAYLLALAERERPHELSAGEQHILDELADPTALSQWTLYQQTVRSTPFAKIATAGGALDSRKDSAVLAENPDRTVRQAAWTGRWDAYASRAEIYATLLLGVVRLNDRVAQLKHFPDAPSAVYFKRSLDRRMVSEALAAIASHAELLKSSQRLRAQHVAAMTGITEVHSWDLSLPAPGFVTPRMTLDETRAAALAALKPLGADYVEHFRQLVDPASRRMDVAMERGKRTNGGFSIEAPGVPSGLFVESYERGLLNESRVIIHEGGHAIHTQLMNDSGVSPFYTRGPNWMFEAFATLNEFLLYDHLYRSNTGLQAKAYYLQALIADINFSLFGSAEEGTLEQSIYDGVIAGRIKNAADLDALTLSIWNQYEIWPALEPQLAHTWAAKSLMFQDPLYLVNYLYAGLLATNMLDMIEHDPATFRSRYAQLLAKGFYAPPEELLRTFFGRDLSQRELVEDAMRVLEKRMGALAEIYKKIDTAAPAALKSPTAKPSIP